LSQPLRRKRPAQHHLGLMLCRGVVAPVHSLANTTSPQICVGGMSGNVTLPGRPFQLDRGNVISAVANVTSQESYVGCLYQCNIGLKRLT
jgi:hypothetical protein